MPRAGGAPADAEEGVPPVEPPPEHEPPAADAEVTASEPAAQSPAPGAAAATPAEPEPEPEPEGAPGLDLSLDPESPVARTAAARAAPKWVGSDATKACQLCEKTFNKVKLPKHHCRRCGFAVCGGCSEHKHVLDRWLAAEKPHDVCETQSAEELRVCTGYHDFLVAQDASGGHSGHTPTAAEPTADNTVQADACAKMAEGFMHMGNNLLGARDAAERGLQLYPEHPRCTQILRNLDRDHTDPVVAVVGHLKRLGRGEADFPAVCANVATTFLDSGIERSKWGSQLDELAEKDDLLDTFIADCEKLREVKGQVEAGLYSAVTARNVDDVREALDNDLEEINLGTVRRNDEGTPEYPILTQACQEGDLAMVNMMLDRADIGAHLMGVGGSRARTALHYAAMRGYVGVVEALIMKGADKDWRAEGRYADTPFTDARYHVGTDTDESKGKSAIGTAVRLVELGADHTLRAPNAADAALNYGGAVKRGLTQEHIDRTQETIDRTTLESILKEYPEERQREEVTFQARQQRDRGIRDQRMVTGTRVQVDDRDGVYVEWKKSKVGGNTHVIKFDATVKNRGKPEDVNLRKLKPWSPGESKAGKWRIIPGCAGMSVAETEALLAEPEVTVRSTPVHTHTMNVDKMAVGTINVTISDYVRRRLVAAAPQFNTCLDRPYVQKEIGWAQKYNKKIIVLVEKEQHRPGFFDYAKAAEKYAGTEWEAILGIDAISFQRDQYLADAMLENMFAKASSEEVTAAESPINLPGVWEFFLSHHQAMGGDQMKSLSFLFDKAGKTNWYDNGQLDKSKAAMEEGVKHCKNFVLLLTAGTQAQPQHQPQHQHQHQIVSAGTIPEEPETEPEPTLDGGELEVGLGESAFSTGPEGSDAGSAPSSAPSDVDELDRWLAQVGLARYAPQIKKCGYERMKALLVAEEKDIVEMSEDAEVKMKTPHKRLLVAEWKELVAARTKGQAGSLVVKVSPTTEPEPEQ